MVLYENITIENGNNISRKTSAVEKLRIYCAGASWNVHFGKISVSFSHPFVEIVRKFSIIHSRNGKTAYHSLLT